MKIALSFYIFAEEEKVFAMFVFLEICIKITSPDIFCVKLDGW